MRNSALQATPLETDVFIVGGGPAGLAAAIAARQKGFRVAIADSATPPVDKACGEGLMPDGIAALRELGVTIPAAQRFPFRGIRFVEGNLTVQSDFSNERGWGIRRTTLHTALAERAAALGVEMHWGRRVVGLNGNNGEKAEQQRGISLEGRAIRARWIIGADGQNSHVRQWAQFTPARKKGLRYGFSSHFQTTPWSDYVEVHWGRDCQIYVTPIGRQEICVAVLTANPKSRLADVLKFFPSLAKRVEHAVALAPEMGGVSSSLTMAEVTRKSAIPVALIGDASGSVDAIAGEGLTLAFRQALALAEALEQNDLAAYEFEHRRARKRPVMMSRLLMVLSEHRYLRYRVLSAFASEPSLFSKLLAAHTGAAVSPFTALQTMWSLGWKILNPQKNGQIDSGRARVRRFAAGLTGDRH
ncbi:MAG: NAD(P)/FAD-dependent oxidoreductase [Candidatus Acidiferrales bacterium]